MSTEKMFMTPPRGAHERQSSPQRVTAAHARVGGLARRRLGLKDRSLRGGTAAARNRDEGGLLDRQLRHRLHQRDEVDERREGLVQKVRIDPSWFLRARAGRWRFVLILEVFEVRFKNLVYTQVFLGSKGEARVGRTGGSDGCSTRTAAHPPLLVCAWRSAWPEAGGVLPTCRDEGGSRKGCVRRA